MSKFDEQKMIITEVLPKSFLVYNYFEQILTIFILPIVIVYIVKVKAYTILA